MMIGLETFSHTFDFPRTETPEWSAKVERWYQLDAAAFALPETFWRHREILRTRPAVIFLASPLASNITDAQFVTTSAPSPAKFVHTLANIRGASLLAVMEWAGEVYCLQKDPQTIITGISEGMHAVKSSGQEAWICAGYPVPNGDASHLHWEPGTGGKFTGHILRLRPDPKNSPVKISEIHSQNMANAAARDMGLLHWLQEGSGRFQAADFELQR